MTSPAEPPVPTDPVPGPSRPSSRSATLQLILVAIAFAATVAIIFGLGAIARPAPSASPSRSQAAGASDGPSPSSPSASTAHVTTEPTSGASASSPGRSAPPSPTGAASPLAVADPVLVGAGDIATCDLAFDTGTAKLIEALPGTVFTAGDNAYPDGAAADFRDCYGPTWGRFLDRTHPVPGNHDHLSEGLAGYLGYFGKAAAPDGDPWYSFDLGAWHIVMLDSECGFIGGCGTTSAEGRWLADDLTASDARCTLAIWHEPRFSSGEHGGTSTVAPFWQLLSAVGADVVVNGHDHDYERFAPQRPSGRADAAGGIREFVVGTGGQSLRPFATVAANSERRIAAIHGVLRLVLHPSSYDWQFIPSDGSMTDQGTTACH